MTAANALRSGRFRDAFALLQESDENDPTVAAPLVETLYGIGRLDKARLLAERVLKRSVDHSIRSRCLSTLAALERDNGRLKASIVLCQRAVDAALEAKDDSQFAIAATELLERTCDRQGFSASIPLASTARRAVTRVGDPQVSARLHISFGRLEARVGHFERARRHFDLGRNLLALAPSDWLNASVDLDESSVLTLVGDVDGAMELAQRGAANSASSGWSRGRVVAAANLAHLFVSVGRFAEAKEQLEAANKQDFKSGAYDLVLADTRAHLAMSVGDLAGAESILRETEARAELFGPSYFSRYATRWCASSCFKKDFPRLTRSRKPVLL